MPPTPTPRHLQDFAMGRIRRDAARCADPSSTFRQCLLYHQAWLDVRRCERMGLDGDAARLHAIAQTTAFAAFLAAAGHSPEAVTAWLRKYRLEHADLEREYWEYAERRGEEMRVAARL